MPPPSPPLPSQPFRCASQAADLNLHQLMNSATLLLAKEAAVAQHGNPTHGNGSSSGDGSNSSGNSMTGSSMGGGARRKRASPTRVWECLAAVASGDLRGLLESEAANAGGGLLDTMAASGAGGGGRPAVELRGGTGGEVAAGLSCQRLLVEAGAFERFGYSDMAVACARSVLQVSFLLVSAWMVLSSSVQSAAERLPLVLCWGRCAGRHILWVVRSGVRRSARRLCRLTRCVRVVVECHVLARCSSRTYRSKLARPRQAAHVSWVLSRDIVEAAVVRLNYLLARTIYT